MEVTHQLGKGFMSCSGTLSQDGNMLGQLHQLVMFPKQSATKDVGVPVGSEVQTEGDPYILPHPSCRSVYVWLPNCLRCGRGAVQGRWQTSFVIGSVEQSRGVLKQRLGNVNGRLSSNFLPYENRWHLDGGTPASINSNGKPFWGLTELQIF